MNTPNYPPVPEHWSCELQDSLDVGLTYHYTQEKEIISALMFGSYCANRDYGMTPFEYGGLFGWSNEKIEVYENKYQSLKNK